MGSTSLGIRLVLKLGKKELRPAPAAVMAALQRVRIVNDADSEDGFELTINLNKGQQGEFDLLRSGVLDPDTRVAIGVLIGAQLHPLADGKIYHQQVTPVANGGAFTLTVMGRSIAVMLDLKQRSASYPGQKASDIVRKILGHYATEGIVGLDDIKPTQEQPSEQRLIPSQNSTDLAYIRTLAERKGLIFYIEPATLGTTKVYWGPPDRKTTPFPALLYDLGPATNVIDLRFSHNPLAPIKVEGETLEPGQKNSQTIKAPKTSPLLSVAKPTAARRTVLLPGAARMGPAAAREAAAAMEARAPDALTAEGSVDTAHYGAVLRAQRVISVRGAGRSLNGNYMIRQVTHEIEPGKYIQQFRLSRKGLGATK
jgi:hypothetical protein